MRTTHRISFGLLGLALALAPVQPASAATTEVAIKNFAFSPEAVTAAVGETVQWTNQDGTSHTVTADNGSFDSGSKGQGGTFERTFDAAGTFAYSCAIHPSMQGSVVVGTVTPTTAATTTTTAPTTVAAPPSETSSSTVVAAGATADDAGGGTPGWVAPGIAALVLAAGLGAWALRRRNGALS